MYIDPYNIKSFSVASAAAYALSTILKAGAVALESDRSVSRDSHLPYISFVSKHRSPIRQNSTSSDPIITQQLQDSLGINHSCLC